MLGVNGEVVRGKGSWKVREASKGLSAGLARSEKVESCKKPMKSTLCELGTLIFRLYLSELPLEIQTSTRSCFLISFPLKSFPSKSIPRKNFLMAQKIYSI
jgi:hypothetical protein